MSKFDLMSGKDIRKPVVKLQAILDMKKSGIITKVDNLEIVGAHDVGIWNMDGNRLILTACDYDDNFKYPMLSDLLECFSILRKSRSKEDGGLKRHIGDQNFHEDITFASMQMNFDNDPKDVELWAKVNDVELPIVKITHTAQYGLYTHLWKQ